MRYVCLLWVAFAVAACNYDTPPCTLANTQDVVYVVGRDWHAELGIPVDELDSHLAFYRSVFPGARVIMFGYGKKTFFTAPVDTFSEYCLGPVPGPAVIHAVGLSVTPLEAYPAEDTIMLALPPGGSKALSQYLWNDLEKDPAGKPRIVAPSTHPAGLFYAARSQYSLLHTCNRWTAEALHAGGLPVSSSAVFFSGQVMERAQQAASQQCPHLP